MATTTGREACVGFAICLAALLAALFTANTVRAEAATGKMTGVLKDPSGAVVPGGQIEVKNLESGAARSATTDQQGRYGFDSLPVGLYEASATSAGFATGLRRDIAVTAGGETTVNFELSIAKSMTSVSVTGQAITAGSETIVPARARTSDTASLLANIPGVSLYGNGGVSSLPAIHGMADDQVRVKVDGMDLISACANHMNPALSYMDPSNVGAIDVFAGITPVSMGGDSIGGTISVQFARARIRVGREGSRVGRPGRDVLSQQRHRVRRQSCVHNRE